jgi:transposase
MRQVGNAILYVLKAGCQWRQLPCEFPTWSAIYYYFYCWSYNEAWERLHHLLRSRWREKCGRHKHPTAGCLDSLPRQRGYGLVAKPWQKHYQLRDRLTCRRSTVKAGNAVIFVTRFMSILLESELIFRDSYCCSMNSETLVLIIKFRKWKIMKPY